MTYGPSIQDVYKRLAECVDRITKGIPPGEMPIERPKAVELVVNRTAAKSLGITIPPVLLAVANKVI